MDLAAPPDLGPTWRWLAHSRHPSAELLLRRARLEVPWGIGVEGARTELLVDPAMAACLSQQRADGSWGTASNAGSRVLSTLWVVKALIEAGLDAQVAAVDSAITFLSRHAVTDAGYFTVSGTDSGVLPCYVGLVSRLFRDAGRIELVGPQVEWLTRYQQVGVAGQARRTAEEWGHGLDRRFGGCFSSTSCLIGVVRATQAWAGGSEPAHGEALAVSREALMERSLAFTRDGERLLDLPSPLKDPGGWALPAFPTDWRIDAIDALHAVALGEGQPDPRVGRAIALLMAARRDDGSWARGWHVTSPYLKGLGVAPRGKGSPIVTARALVALALLTAAAPAD
ncbi:hypothetical protein LGT39_10570 [Demequina sp. TTPB684]|uniref:hypothetical protein n=1 Tax=unclassified Demequina TaxID=2620311 RepID=UPI001CF50659|nr:MULTISPECIES: hypothetical protein [unclassified Demequina]MCB2413286.1 hypothetical protein [Demequina sp. TTPB684]UPU88994.1 hypothetical protein LGT36_003470 [Demequina sp. TMPB413]